MIGLNLDARRSGCANVLRHNGSDLSSQTVVARLSLTIIAELKRKCMSCDHLEMA
jgi:hypothetical protein